MSKQNKVYHRITESPKNKLLVNQYPPINIVSSHHIGKPRALIKLHSDEHFSGPQHCYLSEPFLCPHFYGFVLVIRILVTPTQKPLATFSIFIFSVKT